MATWSLTIATWRRVKSVGCSQLNTRHLALVVSPDEEGTLARAAAATDLTQPAASKLLRRVESTRDVALFDRRRECRNPSWISIYFGLGVFPHRHDLMADFIEEDVLRRELEHRVRLVTGRLAVGRPESCLDP
jgi:hypothetical protein